MCIRDRDKGRGYAEARTILQRRFGNPTTIAHRWVARMTSRKTQTLRKLADEARKCQNALRALHALHEMDVFAHLQAVMDQMPKHVQGRWQGKAQDAEQRGDRLLFSDMVEFLEHQAQRENHPIYGNDRHKDRALAAPPASRTTGRQPRNLSLIHISEPTRPY